jgi:hypothetical protein
MMKRTALSLALAIPSFCLAGAPPPPNYNTLANQVVTLQQQVSVLQTVANQVPALQQQLSALNTAISNEAATRLSADTAFSEQITSGVAVKVYSTSVSDVEVSVVPITVVTPPQTIATLGTTDNPLPAGKYLVSAKAYAQNQTHPRDLTSAECFLESVAGSADPFDKTVVAVDANDLTIFPFPGSSMMVLEAIVDMPNPGTVSMTCFPSVFEPVHLNQVKLIAQEIAQ